MYLKRTFRKIFALSAAIMMIATFTACSSEDTPIPEPTDDIEEQLRHMTLSQKVGQMFFVRPEALDTTIHWNVYDDLMPLQLQTVNNCMKDVNQKYPVGGVILYAWNIKDETQLAQFMPQLKALNGKPLMCIDEEGGRVARIANNDNFHVKKYESMAVIGATGDPANAYECGNTIGTYLNRYGFDIDFAPVADVNTNPKNIVIGPRAFSANPAVAAPMVTNYLQGLKDAGIVGCIQAGADIVLCSKDFIQAFNTVVKAVEDGTITEERINQSVRRILKLKKQYE